MSSVFGVPRTLPGARVGGMRLRSSLRQVIIAATDIFVPFENGKPTRAPIDVLTGFVNEAGEANGRPVGVAVDKGGAVLVADDVGNAIWRVAAAAQRP